jgi:hypothetical protein
LPQQVANNRRGSRCKRRRNEFASNRMNNNRFQEFFSEFNNLFILIRFVYFLYLFLKEAAVSSNFVDDLSTTTFGTGHVPSSPSYNQSVTAAEEADLLDFSFGEPQLKVFCLYLFHFKSVQKFINSFQKMYNYLVK